MKEVIVDPNDLFSTFCGVERFTDEERDAIAKAMAAFLARTGNPLHLLGEMVAILFAHVGEALSPDDGGTTKDVQAMVMAALSCFMLDRAKGLNGDVAMSVLEQMNEADMGKAAADRLDAASDAVFEKIDAERKENAEKAIGSVREMLGGKA